MKNKDWCVFKLRAVMVISSMCLYDGVNSNTKTRFDDKCDKSVYVESVVNGL